MTNGEKYRTAKERAEAFYRYNEMPDGAYADVLAVMDWLDLEAPAEEPLPCPFCGCKDIKFAIFEDTSDGLMATPTIYCRDCGVRFHLDWDIASHLDEVTDEHKDKLLAKWNNRVARAARKPEISEHIQLCGKEANDGL